jgi:hypothetical protein
MTARLAAVAVLAAACAGCAARSAKAAKPVLDAEARRDAIARARVWAPTDVPRMDIARGPGGKGSFPPGATVSCTYVERTSPGNTPKFYCRLRDGREVKVKYGRANGEVYAEVAATRLLWALGFAADAMYPATVTCLGCPKEPGGPPRPGVVTTYDAAAIERKAAGRELEGRDGDGWSWTELDTIEPAPGGSSRAERDALKLLAAMLQHTDSKADQQSLVCRDDGPRDRKTCRHPWLLISDLGKTFGRANAFNRDAPGSVNLAAWAGTPMWNGTSGCRANLTRSVTGTLEDPVISDEGRRFLASLLRRLTDAQLRALFTVARFPMRSEARFADAGGRDVEAWVAAFKEKVAQIADRSCTAVRQGP